MKYTPPTEPEVRAALRSALHASLAHDQLVDEFWVPQSNERVDIVAIGSILRAFEIKTERDTLKRLPRQAGAYGRLFDQCIVVAASRHVAEAMAVVPPWWGVWKIVRDASVNFEELRQPGRNPHLDCETLVRLLWRDEVCAALIDLGATPPSTAGRSSMWASLLRLLDEGDIRRTVIQALLSRDPKKARISTRRFAIHSGS